MKKIKNLLCLGAAAIIGATAIGCNRISKKDTPAIHVFANSQKDFAYNEWDYTDYYYATSSVITTSFASGSSLEYGKDVDMIIKANDYCLLSNYKNAEYEEGNQFTPYTGVGYAVPTLWYGNPLNPYTYPISNDYYTYTQDENDSQTFHLKIKGEAFQRNIVVDFGINTDSKENKNNKVTVLNSNVLANECFGDYSNYFNFNTEENSLLNEDGLVLQFSFYKEYSIDPKFENNDIIKNSNLFTFDNFTDSNFKLYKIEHGKTAREEYKGKISYKSVKNGKYLNLYIPWNEIYDVSTYTKKIDKFDCQFAVAPTPITKVTSSYDDGNKAFLDSGYGCFTNCAIGSIDRSSSSYFNWRNYVNCDSIFYPFGTDYDKYYIARNYRCTFKYDQGSSADIVWPNVNITYKSKGGNTYSTSLDDTLYVTNWRRDYYTENDSCYESELPYKLTKDGKFVIVCINPKEIKKDGETYDGRTFSGISKQYGYETPILDKQQHNLFMVYDYLGSSSYLYNETYDMCDSVNISIN